MIENKFVIKLDTFGHQNYYSTHGHFAGKDEVMSYTTKKNAKQFETEKEALDYIDLLPAWTKKNRYIAEEFTIFDAL